MISLLDLQLHFFPSVSVSSMTQLISGANVSLCGYSRESVKFWAFSLTPYSAFYFAYQSYLLILWTLNESYCITCSRILLVSVFCVLQGSRVTPLNCGEIYDMEFVANFTEKTTAKNFENWSTFLKLMNECTVAQFLLRHGVFWMLLLYRMKSVLLVGSITDLDWWMMIWFGLWLSTCVHVLQATWVNLALVAW